MAYLNIAVVGNEIPLFYKYLSVMKQSTPIFAIKVM